MKATSSGRHWRQRRQRRHSRIPREGDITDPPYKGAVNVAQVQATVLSPSE